MEKEITKVWSLTWRTLHFLYINRMIVIILLSDYEKVLRKNVLSYLNHTYKYHVSSTDGKILVRINLLFYLYFPLLSHPTFVCFFPVGLSLLIQYFQVTSVSWLGQMTVGV